MEVRLNKVASVEETPPCRWRLLFLSGSTYLKISQNYVSPHIFYQFFISTRKWQPMEVSLVCNCSEKGAPTVILVRLVIFQIVRNKHVKCYLIKIRLWVNVKFKWYWYRLLKILSLKCNLFMCLCWKYWVHAFYNYSNS